MAYGSSRGRSLVTVLMQALYIYLRRMPCARACRTVGAKSNWGLWWRALGCAAWRIWLAGRIPFLVHPSNLWVTCSQIPMRLLKVQLEAQEICTEASLLLYWQQLAMSIAMMVFRTWSNRVNYHRIKSGISFFQWLYPRPRVWLCAPDTNAQPAWLSHHRLKYAYCFSLLG